MPVALGGCGCGFGWRAGSVPHPCFHIHPMHPFTLSMRCTPQPIHGPCLLPELQAHLQAWACPRRGGLKPTSLPRAPINDTTSHHCSATADTPGLRVHCLDPPVITIDDFCSPEQCRAIMDASEASGVGVGGRGPCLPALGREWGQGRAMR